METETSSYKFDLTQEDAAEVLAKEVLNSHNPTDSDFEYKHLQTQSQNQSQPGPSNEAVGSRLRKRGRPTTTERQLKISQQRTRESKREKKCPTVFKYESFVDPVSETEWSEDDKKILQVGLWEVGMEDIKGLQRFLPHKTEKEIANKIAYYKNLANKTFADSLAHGEDFEGIPANVLKKLDEWIHFFKEKAKASGVSLTAISNYFAIFAEYGELPSPEESGGVDYRAIYRFIHCMMNGLPPYGLDSSTLQELMQILDSVDKELNNPVLIHTLEDRLFNLPNKPDEEKFGRTYERMSKNASGMQQFLRNPVINPLGIPKHYLLRPIVNRDESDDD